MSCYVLKHTECLNNHEFHAWILSSSIFRLFALLRLESMCSHKIEWSIMYHKTLFLILFGGDIHAAHEAYGKFLILLLNFPILLDQYACVCRWQKHRNSVHIDKILTRNALVSCITSKCIVEIITNYFTTIYFILRRLWH